MKRPRPPEPIGPDEAVLRPPPAEPAEPIEPAVAVRSSGRFVRLRVHRRKQGDREAHFDDFEVAVEPGRTLLDALIEIRRQRDPSLAIRHSCMHASCGACGVRVDGRESLACDVELEDLAGRHARRRIRTVKVEPLANQRLVADLATDMVDFHARFEVVGMPLIRTLEPGLVGRANSSGRRGAGLPVPEPPEGMKAFTRFESCIECGLCLSACPIARARPDYLGPAALAAASRIDQEPRGCDVSLVRAIAAEPDSVWSCRDVMRCSVVCPTGVEPAGALIALRQRIATRRLHRRESGLR